LQAAEEAGFSKRGPTYELLKGWLARRPPSELITAWKQYVVALVANLDDTSKRSLKAELIGRARMVAEAAGGFLSLTARISDTKKRVLDDLEKTFQVS
jgi:hypothetical protein